MESGLGGWGQERQREEPAARESGQKSERVYILPEPGNRAASKNVGVGWPRRDPKETKPASPVVLDSHSTLRKSISAIYVPLSVIATVSRDTSQLPYVTCSAWRLTSILCSFAFCPLFYMD